MGLSDYLRRPADWPEPAAVNARAWAETAFLASAFLGLCLWLRPADPFFLASRFPWTWLGPILLALRHGSKSGLMASLLVLLAWSIFGGGGDGGGGSLIGGAGAGGIGAVAAAFPKGYFLGGFIAALVCGEFRDLWQARIQREKRTREHLEHRLAALGKAHGTLSLSHERLQSAFLNHPPTLRDALAESRAGGRPGDQGLDAASGQAFLGLLARFFQLEIGALHLMAPDGRHVLDAPLARLGPARDLDGKDPLVAACLRSRELCHALPDSPGKPGSYLFAAPLLTCEGAVLGLLVGESMPFFAFHPGNLRALFAVAGYHADRLAEGAAAARVTERFPDCPPGFAAEYLRLHRLGGQAGVESALAALVPAGEGGDGGAYRSDAARERAAAAEAGRGLDLFWHRTLPGGRRAVVALLPFCGEAPAHAFLARLEDASRAQSGGSHGNGAGRPPFRKLARVLEAGDPLEGLAAFLAAIQTAVPAAIPADKDAPDREMAKHA